MNQFKGKVVSAYLYLSCKHNGMSTIILQLLTGILNLIIYYIPYHFGTHGN